MKGMRVRIKLGVFKEVKDLLDSLYFLSSYEAGALFHYEISSGFFFQVGDGDWLRRTYGNF